jgi:hypothetical protein
VGLVWSNDPKSCAGGNLATGRVSHAREVKGNDPDEREMTFLLKISTSVKTHNQPHNTSRSYKIMTQQKEEAVLSEHGYIIS